MSAKDLIDAGRLAEAIEATTAEVRARPTDVRARTTLFELLCYNGDWDRATRQLTALGGPDSDPKLQAGVQVYHELIDAERKRTALLTDGLRPRFLLAPPPEVVARLDALACLREGRIEDAREAIRRAEDHHTPTSGDADGLRFADIRDSDDLLAPVLEVFTRAGYFWIPWSQVQYLDIEPPTRLRDLLWAPAKLASHDGQLGEVFLPSLYPGTGQDPDEAIKLGRKTDWVEEGDGAVVRGRGRKLLFLDDEARTLADLRSLRFDLAASETES